MGLDQTDEPDTLLLDVSGVAHLFGGEAALTHRVVDAFGRAGRRAWRGRHVQRPGRSPALVQCVPGARIEQSQLVPRDVPALEGPLPPIVPPGDTAVLEALPVAALRAGERTEQQLQRLGIVRLGQLRQLPRASLAARFGEDLARRLDQLRARPRGPRRAHRRRRIGSSVGGLTRRQRSGPRSNTWCSSCWSNWRRNCATGDSGVLQLECRLLCPPHPPPAFQVGLFQPTAEPAHLFGLLRLQLERLRLPDAVEEIQLRPTATAPLRTAATRIVWPATR